MKNKSIFIDESNLYTSSQEYYIGVDPKIFRNVPRLGEMIERPFNCLTVGQNHLRLGAGNVIKVMRKSSTTTVEYLNLFSISTPTLNLINKYFPKLEGIPIIINNSRKSWYASKLGLYLRHNERCSIAAHAFLIEEELLGDIVKSANLDSIREVFYSGYIYYRYRFVIKENEELPNRTEETSQIYRVVFRFEILKNECVSSDYLTLPKKYSNLLSKSGKYYYYIHNSSTDYAPTLRRFISKKHQKSIITIKEKQYVAKVKPLLYKCDRAINITPL